MQLDFPKWVYNTVNGLYRPGCGGEGVKNAYDADMPCSALYSEAFEAYQRLCDRLGVIDEDDDIETIYYCFGQICEYIGLRMYHYGAAFSHLTPEEKLSAAKTIITPYK